MDNVIGLEIIEVVEKAAIASARWMGKGEKNIADEVAVEAMRERMNKIHMRGKIVIGEGERDVLLKVALRVGHHDAAVLLQPVAQEGRVQHQPLDRLRLDPRRHQWREAA